MQHWTAELAQWALLVVPIIREWMKDKAGEVIVGGIKKAQEAIKDMDEHRVELFLFLYSEIEDVAAVKDFERWWRLTETGGRKTYPHANSRRNECYPPGYAYLVTDSMTKLFKYGSGMEYEVDADGKPKPKRIREMGEKEREARRHFWNDLVHRSDEDRDTMVLIVHNNLPQQFWDRLVAHMKDATKPVSAAAATFAATLDPVNQVAEDSLNDFRASLGLKPMFHGRPGPAQTDFATRLKQAWKG